MGEKYVRHDGVHGPNICDFESFGGPPGEQVANARLIADAPQLLEERDALLVAANGILSLLDDGRLVRDVSHDHEPSWAIKQIPFVQKLKALVDAIALVEGTEMNDRLTWDEEKRLQNERLDRDVERIMAQAPRCPIHGSHHVSGVGIGGKFFCYGTGICPSCFWEYWKGGLV